MKTSHLFTMFGTVCAVTTTIVMLRSSPGLSRDLAPVPVAADPAVAEATAHAAYQAHLAANNAAAERWKSTRARNHTPALSADDELIATNHGCPEGTQFWQRDRLTELCATPCTSDLDCAPEEGRCRVIDVFDESKVPAAPLVDDTAAQEIEALITDESRPEPPLLLCDPFWDLVDLPDLELFEVESAALE